MLRVGIVGFGFMGRMHYKCWQALDGAQVVAICDSNPNLIEDTKKAVGNIAGAADEVDFSALKLFNVYDRFLAEAGVDAISLALPTHLHADFSIRALEAGVHVLCEKPMALDIDSCQRMVEAAERTGKVLQIGHCVRFWPEYAHARELVASGKYGRVRAATLQRLSAPPVWAVGGWLADEQRSGGMILDLHIHDTDYVQYLLGTPTAVQSRAARGDDGRMIHVVSNYLYDDDKVIIAEGTWAMSPSFGFEMSFNLMLEGATLTYDCTRSPAYRVCPVDGEAYTPDVGPGDGYTRQIEHFARTIRGEQVPEVLTLAQSLESVRIVLAEIASAKTGKPVSMD